MLGAGPLSEPLVVCLRGRRAVLPRHFPPLAGSTTARKGGMMLLGRREVTMILLGRREVTEVVRYVTVVW